MCVLVCVCVRFFVISLCQFSFSLLFYLFIYLFIYFWIYDSFKKEFEYVCKYVHTNPLLGHCKFTSSISLVINTWTFLKRRRYILHLLVSAWFQKLNWNLILNKVVWIETSHNGDKIVQASHKQTNAHPIGLSCILCFWLTMCELKVDKCNLDCILSSQEAN